MEDILSAAEELLGPAVRVETHRGWATFWCPFHGDKDRAGKGGKPNFGVNLTEGYWKCLDTAVRAGAHSIPCDKNLAWNGRRRMQNRYPHARPNRHPASRCSMKP
jgi:hypothetical protein